MTEPFLLELERLLTGLESGEFHTRLPEDLPDPAEARLAERTNRLLDQFSQTGGLVSESISRIAIGDIPDRITCSLPPMFQPAIDQLNLLIRSMNEIAVTALMVASGTVDGLIIQERSDNDRTVRAFNLMIERLNDIITVIDSLIDGVQQADFSIRGDVERFSGVWQEMVANINALMEKISASFVAVRESKEKFKNLFESAPDGIFITDFEGEIISFNTAAMVMFDVRDPALFYDINVSALYRDPDRDRTEFLKKLLQTRTVENHTANFVSASGRAFIGNLSSRVIRYEGRECIQTIIRDISHIIEMENQLRRYANSLKQMVDEKTHHLRKTNTELSKTVATLEETREQMARQAYSAGMAEIAVSVLHNIGNAITPVNIRLGRMIGSPVVSPKLMTALDTIRTLSDQGRIETDQQKQTLAALLKGLASALSEINTRFASDLSFVQKNVDHIKEIIARQQNYAGVYGAETLVDINNLIRDSVEMLRDSLDKRAIDLSMDLETLPPMELDSSKIMQIFVNLLKNAYEAIDMVDDPVEKKIHIVSRRIQDDGRAVARIVFEDTGVGMTDDIKREIFKFNFSTKNRVSGFGLHDCANYIRAKKGTIALTSDGKNKGARMTVQLAYPADPRKRA